MNPGAGTRAPARLATEPDSKVDLITISRHLDEQIGNFSNEPCDIFLLKPCFDEDEKFYANFPLKGRDSVTFHWIFAIKLRNEKLHLWFM